MTASTSRLMTPRTIIVCAALMLTACAVAQTPVANAASAVITVSGDQRFQTMDGFGVSINAHSWNNGELKPALDMLVDQNGSRIFRVVMEMTDWEQTNDNADPNSYNWAYYNPIYSGPDFEAVWSTIGYLRSKGIPSSNIMLSFMGIGPAWMGGASVSTSQEDEWVEEVVSAAYYGRAVRGAEFGVLSPDNEPDWGHNEGITMSSTQYARVMNKVAVRLDGLGLSTMRLAAPETAAVCSGAGDYWAQMTAYPTLMSKVDHMSLHNYSGDTCNATASIKASTYPGKSLWMTEFSLYDQAQSLIEQNATALLVWDGYDSVYRHAILNGLGSAPGNDSGNAPALISYNPTTKTYTPRKEFYLYSQLFKYVPPGAVRVSASSSNSAVRSLAFQDPASGRITLVGNNTSGSTQTLTIALNNLGTIPASLQYFQTNTTNNMSQGADVAVTNGLATATVPAGTVFTLTGSAGGPAGPPTPTVSVTSDVSPPSLMGSQAVAPYADRNAAGSAEAFSYVADASGPAKGLSLYVDSGSTPTKVDVGIYSDVNNHPGDLLAVGTIAAPQAGAWSVAAMTPTLTLTQGTAYWIGFVATGGSLNYRDENTGNCSESYSTLGLTSLPTTWSSGQSWPTCTISAYVTGDAPTSASPPPSAPSTQPSIPASTPPSVPTSTAPSATSAPPTVPTSTPPPVPTSTPPTQAIPITLDTTATTHPESADTTMSVTFSTTQSNALLVAFITSDGPKTGPQSISDVTGAGLTWSLRQRVNSQAGTAEIWTAAAPAPLSGATLVATRADGSYLGSLTVAAFINADTSAVGAVAGSSAPDGAPATSLSSTKTGSVVWGVGNDWDRATARSVGVGQTLVDEFLAPVNDTFWVQRVNDPTVVGQVVTLSDGGPSDDQWNLAAIEILPVG